jgi:drug/metabolite transporter (DMT)-like permease
MQIQWNAFEWYHWVSLAFVVIGSTFLSYLFIVYGVSVLGSTITGTYIYTQPVFATITSIILFQEKLTIIKIVAAILIFTGVFLVNRKKLDS